ncbi:tetratricopeptide repeat protein [Streptomyces sp. NPDC020996]|uniref:ATP-binding protein n=1 Tax=Streptomyces sp. NPDC020996 TaxID=3154791 RepID=UPI003400A862
MDGAVKRLNDELQSLYKAAGEPTLSQLVRLAAKQRPPIKISDSTISAWLNAGHVPGPGPKERYFVTLVTFLQSRAKKNGYQARPGEAWLHLLHEARSERNAHRGGRPQNEKNQVRASTPDRMQSVENLPLRPIGVVGRDESLRDLINHLDTRQTKQKSTIVTTVSGMGGTGKTTLAIEAAHRLRDLGLFTGGILFVDMRGYSSNDSDLKAENAAELLLRHLEVPENESQLTGQEVLELWRRHTSLLSDQNRPLLVILDNVSTASQVAPLIPPSSDHRILITTRHVLASLPSRQIELGELTESSAAKVIDQALRIARPEDSRVTDNPQDSAELVSLCGALPLALQIVAALLKVEPNRPLASLVEELQETRNRLDGLEYEEFDALGNPLAVRAAFSLSYRRLSAEEARAFRLLALAPGPDFSLETASVILNVSPSDARRFIRKLMSAHLLLSQNTERWLMHDLIGFYAEEKAVEQNIESSEALSRILRHLLAICEEADEKIRWVSDEEQGARFLSRDEAWEWLVTEHQTLVSAVSYAYRVEADIIAIHLAMNLAGYFKQNHHATDWEYVYEVALKACRRYGEPRLDIEVLSTIGRLYDAAHQPEAASRFHCEALSLLKKVGHHPSKASVLNSAASSMVDALRYEEALPLFRKALAEYRKEGDIRGQGMVLHNLGSILSNLGEPKQAIEFLQEDLAICEELGDHRGAGETLNTLGCAHYDLKKYQEAASNFSRSLEIAREFQDLNLAGHALKNLANCYAGLKEFPEALTLYQQALEVQRAIGDRYREAETLMCLSVTYEDVGRIGDAVGCLEEAVAAFQESGAFDGVLAAKRWLHDLRSKNPFYKF